jgi:hypothetical protein
MRRWKMKKKRGANMDEIESQININNEWSAPNEDNHAIVLENAIVHWWLM